MTCIGEENGVDFFKAGKALKACHLNRLDRAWCSAGIGQVDHQVAMVADRANTRLGAIACAVAANHFNGAIGKRGRIVQCAQRFIKIEIRHGAFNADAERRAVQRRGEVGQSMDMRFASAVVVISVVVIVMSFVVMVIMIMIVIGVVLVAMIFVPMTLVPVIMLVMVMIMVFAVLIAMIIGCCFSMVFAIMIVAFRGHCFDFDLHGFFNNWRSFSLQTISGLLCRLAGGEGERARSEEEDRTRHFRLQLSFDRVRRGKYFAETF